MKPWDVVILTEGRYLDATVNDDYVGNVLQEQDLVQKSLESRGLKVTRADWADSKFDWSSTRAILIREIWDYFHRFPEFSKWLDATILQTKLINPSSLIRWNLDKHYLIDLEKRGINICTSRFIEAGDGATLSELQEQEGLSDFVLKPAVSGGGRHTYRVNDKNVEQHEKVFQELIEVEAMMIQPFQTNILTKGEVAYMVFGGKFSHAILKLAKPGDFRVQDDFGGSVQLYDPSKEEVAFAENVVANTAPLPAYARVDIIWDNNNELAVTELELIEPELWFRYKPESVGLYADVVVGAIEND